MSLHSTELTTEPSFTIQLLHVTSLNWQLNSLTHQPTTSRHFTQLTTEPSLTIQLLHITSLNWQLTTEHSHSPTTNSLLQTVLLITSRHGPHRKHRSSIVALVSVAAETCLPNRCLETSCLTPSFSCCLHVCCGRYLATTADYRVTA
jgi:dolichol kinase